jgi:hypothetical protein
MTFVEELRELSESVVLRHKIERQLANIKDKMKTAASNGYRSFKIEVFSIDSRTKVLRLSDTRADNYYCVYTLNESVYMQELASFLTELGFDMSEAEIIRAIRDGYVSTIISVIW